MARAKKGIAAPAAILATAALDANGAPATAEAPSSNPETAPASDAANQAGASEIVPLNAGYDPGNDPALVVADEDVKLSEAAAADRLINADKDELLSHYEGKMISVKSHKARRRAGMAFGPEAVEIDTDYLMDDELLALLSDPQLTVVIVE